MPNVWIRSATLVLAAVGACQAEDISDTPTIRTGERSTASSETSGTHSWEMPALTVQGHRERTLREEDRIGGYGQPRWTARRRFAETRVYVIPEGQFEFEYWLVVETPKKPDALGKRSPKIQQVYEAEIGLPYRFQLDLYQIYEKTGNSHGTTTGPEQKFELRWALADWGVIPFNPTLYAEWAQEPASPDHVECKLLLGDELKPRVHWATNFVFEHETGALQENSWEMTNALSYTLRDERFSVGLEDKFAWINTIDPLDNGRRTGFAREILLGPSIQYRPLPQMHINLSVLAGLTDDSPQSKTVMVAGWEF